MKYFLLITTMLILLVTKSRAQNITPLENNSQFSEPSSMIIESNENYYYISPHNIFSSNADSVYSSKLSVVKLNRKTNFKQILTLNLDTNFVYFASFYAERYKDSLYFLLQKNPTKPSPSIILSNPVELMLLKVDTNLSHQTYMTLPYTDMLSANAHLININDSKMLLAYYEGSILNWSCNVKILQKSDFAEIHSTNLTVWNFQNWTFTGDSIYHLIDAVGNIRSFDTSLQIIQTNINSPAIPNTNEYVYSRAMPKKGLPNYQYCHIDTSLSIIPPLNQQRKVIYKHNHITNEKQIVYEQIFPSNISINNAYQSIDYIDTNSIFISSCLYPCSVTQFNSLCLNEVEVSKINTNGALQWSKTFGNDASYQVISTLATSDSGVLVSFHRFKYGFNNKEYDTYYVKLDKDGNEQLNYLPTSSSNVQWNVKDDLVLFPNPSNSIIQIKNENLKTQKLFYRITDMQGSILMKGQYDVNGILISQLANGNYTITIVNEKREELTKLFTKY